MPEPQPFSERPLPRRPDDEQPAEFRREIGGITLAGFEWAGDGPPIVMTHGTGFHARVWDSIARRLPGRRVIALDLRGHGRSSKPDEPYWWSKFSDDTAGLIEALDLREVVGVGHSMGGYTIADAARRALDRFAALVLIDPTIMRSRPSTGPANGSGSGPLDFVSKRRNEWGSVEEMVERFAPRFPYNVWAPGILDDYARYGLLPAPSGEGLILACPPKVEAAVYAGRESPDGDLSQHLDALRLPARVLRARAPEPGEQAAPFTVSPTMPDLAERLPDALDVPLPHLSHFIPMEAPDLVAWHIIEATDAVEAARR